MALSAVTWFGLGRLSAAIPKLDVFSGLTDRPKKESSAINYLIVGSDTREGLTKEEVKRLRVGSASKVQGKRSDTMLLVHISKQRDNAVIISIPRDTFALIPEHTNSAGKTVPAVHSKLNSAYSWGGAPLLIETIEDLSGLRIDHYVEINFAGFVRMVDALGGIDICTKKDISDPKSHLELPAGNHTLDGVDALKYVRSRDFDGLGDLGRMKRQQQFVGAVMRKATSAEVLLNPVKLVDFINSSLTSISVDSGLSQSDLVNLAQELRGLSTNKVRTLTIPLKYYNYSSNGVTASVLWDPVLAPELFNRMKKDLPLVETVQADPSASPTTVDNFNTGTAADNPCSGSQGSSSG